VAWEIKKLGDVCGFQNGFAFKSKLFTSEGLPVLRISNIQHDKISYKRLTFFKKESYNLNFEPYKVNEGDLVIAMSGATTGKIAISDSKEIFYLNQRVGKFQPKDKLYKKYLYYFLTTQIKENLRISQGSAQPNLSTTQIKNFKIPLPPLQIQKKIAKNLDESFEKISKAMEHAERNLKNSKEVFESYLQNVFEKKGEGWEEKKIGEICDLMTGGTPSRAKKDYFDGGKINWLVSGDVNMKEITYCNGKITNEGLKNSNAKYLPVNSIVIALNGQGKTRGKVAMLRVKATCNQSLVSIISKNPKQVLTEYIYHNLNYRYNEIRKITGDSGNDRRGLNMPLLRNINISYPKKPEEQKRFILKFKEFFEHTQKLGQIYTKKLEDLEELKKSILQKAFKGELTESLDE
jgi:type I restriction enzyme, S subunit